MSAETIESPEDGERTVDQPVQLQGPVQSSGMWIGLYSRVATLPGASDVTTGGRVYAPAPAEPRNARYSEISGIGTSNGNDSSKSPTAS